MESRFLLSNFNFEISLIKAVNIESGSNLTSSPNTSGKDVLGDGGFAECSGLEIQMDVQQIQEGGRNDGVIQQVGRAKYQNLVLKRGMFYNADNKLAMDVWEWIQSVVSGSLPVTRYDGIIKVYGHRKSPSKDAPIIATWAFDRALPTKVSGPSLNAKSGDVALEELHLAHEGLRMLFD
ncbi:MAG: phage tail protein [Aliiglaciecola sp.]|uniref:phage tail protein n=1 Tax=Aliiglaciecola sp. TaxID=1872441 RepID=UPI003298AA25